MHQRDRDHHERQAIKCLAAAQHSILTEADLASAILWTCIALIHMAKLDHNRFAFDKVIGWVARYREDCRSPADEQQAPLPPTD